MFQKRVNQSVVKLNVHQIYRSCAIRINSWPSNGESIGFSKSQIPKRNPWEIDGVQILQTIYEGGVRKNEAEDDDTHNDLLSGNAASLASLLYSLFQSNAFSPFDSRAVSS